MDSDTPIVAHTRYMVCGMWYLVCGVWYMVCGTWYVVCGMWYEVCGMWYVVCGMWYVVCGMWDVECGMWLVWWYVYTWTTKKEGRKHANKHPLTTRVLLVYVLGRVSDNARRTA